MKIKPEVTSAPDPGSLPVTHPPAQPAQENPCSLNEALNVIEHWGRRGNTLSGDDVDRFRALADKIAPAQEQPGWKWVPIAHSATPVQTVDIEAAYRAGFIEACKWPEPVSQDADSPAFYRAMAQYKLSQAIGDKT